MNALRTESRNEDVNKEMNMPEHICPAAMADSLFSTTDYDLVETKFLLWDIVSYSFLHS